MDLAAMDSDDFTDRAAVLQRLIAIPENKVCFDCNAENPTWADIWYGIFICDVCAQIHDRFGIVICYPSSIYSESSWPPIQLLLMSIGGNERARVFFEQHGCNHGGDLEAKYTSRAAKLYLSLLLRESSAIMEVKEEPLHSVPRHATNELLDINVTDDLKEDTPERDGISAICMSNSGKKLYGANLTRRTAGLRSLKLIPETSIASSSADLLGCEVNNSPSHSFQDWIKSLFRQEKVGS